jgi:hypothetical protein
MSGWGGPGALSACGYVGVSRQGQSYTETLERIVTRELRRQSCESEEVPVGLRRKIKLLYPPFPYRKADLSLWRKWEREGMSSVPRKEASEILDLPGKRSHHLPDSQSEGKKINLNL